jgi:hypothetical protein
MNCRAASGELQPACRRDAGDEGAGSAGGPKPGRAGFTPKLGRAMRFVPMSFELQQVARPRQRNRWDTGSLRQIHRPLESIHACRRSRHRALGRAFATLVTPDNHHSGRRLRTSG